MTNNILCASFMSHTTKTREFTLEIKSLLEMANQVETIARIGSQSETVEKRFGLCLFFVARSIY